ncbi:MAG: sn-glycerol-3-phosphate import ATP-binding protein UgpC [Alphaproteobacteria bacterium]|nr:sn-glycerol-3-phosphate import ATP-binding protein UgpC [Alphaproteobacteria bacterium]
MSTVTLRDVKKAYGDTPVIHGVSMEIQTGEFIVVVGPSGCGKSTLLRMVAGLEEISDGEIHIAEKLVNNLEPRDRDIAMVFQNYALYPHMSVFDNMAYGLKLRKLPKDEIRAKVEEAADLLQLRPYLERRPRQLSGGQRQRVAMGRAIVREPSVFLFDEPLSNLDAKLRVQMRVEIRKLQRRLGTTSLYVTHDQVEAMTMADRLIVMNAGVAEQIGSPIDLYEHPETVFVAGFIGSPAMNLLDAAAFPGLSLPTDRGPLTVGIRPEHLVVADGGPIGATVDLVEPLGADTIVHAQLPTGDALLIRLPGNAKVTQGTTLSLAPKDEAAVHLFDKDTGRRI